MYLLCHELSYCPYNYLFFFETAVIALSSIQNILFFCLWLQKLDGLKYENLKENIAKVISEIPREKYENIFKGACDHPEKYIEKNKTRKIKKLYKWLFIKRSINNRRLKWKKV